MKKTDTPTNAQLRAKNAELTSRLEEAEETLRAIREGEVDAVIVSGSKGDRVFALSESDNLYRLMAETMNEAGLAATPDGLLVFCNDQACLTLGRTRDQLLGHDLGEFVAAPDADRFRNLLLATATAKSDARIEFQAADGKPMPMHVWASRLDRPDGPLICLVATDLSLIEADRDLIALLRRQQHQLRESEKRLQLATQAAALGVFEVNMVDDTCVWGNQRMFDMYGRSRQDGSLNKAQLIEQAMHPDDVASFEADVETGSRSGHSFQTTFRIRRKSDGAQRWMENSLTVERDGSGQPIRLAGVSADITERKKAEMLLLESEERLRLLAENTGDMIALHSQDGQVLYVSPSTARLATAKDWRTHVHPDDLPRVEQAHLANLRGENTTSEFRHRCTDGSWVWLESKCQIVFGPDGKPCQRVIASLDITERKQAEEVLARMSLRQAEGQKIAHLGSFEYVAESQTTVWSEEEFRIYGLDPAGPSPSYADMLAKHIHPDDAALLREIFGAALRNGSSYELEHRIVRPDGSVRWVFDRAIPFFDGNGRLIRYVGATLDVTDRKQAELRLFEISQRLQALLTALPVGVSFSDDATCRHVTGNPAVLAQFEIIPGDNLSASAPPEDASGRRVQFFVDGRPITDADLPLQRAVAENAVIAPMELDVRLPSGRRWFAEASGAPVRDAQGNVVCGIAVTVDITARKEAERALAQLNAELEQRVETRTAELAATNRELEAFCYSVSHDLRTPLRGMDGFSLALLEDYGSQLDDSGRDFLHRVRTNCQQMSRLIDDLLQLSRLTLAHMRHTAVDLTAIAETTFAELRLADPHRAVEVRIAPGLSAKGDPTLLRTALANLLENAWKFTGQRPDAAIEFGRASLVSGHSSLGKQTASQSPMTTDAAQPHLTNDQCPMTNDAAQPPLTNDQTVFYVRDNGVGFNMQYADKLFTPFQRLHSMTVFPGSGIGLATVQRVIQRHGGRVWFESAPGQGATFYFTVGAKTTPQAES